jgi:hypothetical protein
MGRGLKVCREREMGLNLTLSNKLIANATDVPLNTDWEQTRGLCG